MNRGNLIKMSIGVLVLAALAFFYFTTDRSPAYDWDPDFKVTSKEPYGCYLFYELMKGTRSDEEFTEIEGPIYNTLDQSEVTGANYFFIGEKWYYSDEDLYALSEFVARGNDAYILSESHPYMILEYLEIYSSIYFGSFIDDRVDMKLSGSQAFDVSIEFIKDWEKKSYRWTYADSISDPAIYALGNLRDVKLNYFRVAYGEGNVYFHLSPLVFTNFHLREENKLAYTNSVLADLNDGPVLWDNFSHIPYNDFEGSQSPLSFILSQASLRWAWYILLAIGVIYIVFYTKRKQRVIPVINRPTNTSIAFVKTIGAMYYHQQAHLKIISHQYQLFLTYIRTKYGIPTRSPDETFVKQVSLKSGLKKEKIHEILKEAKRLELLENITTKDVIEYNQLTEHFYRNCK